MKKIRSAISFFFLWATIYPLLAIVKILCWGMSSARTPKKPLRILFLEVFPAENSGYQSRAEKWGRHFRERGYHTRVATLLRSRHRFELLARRENIALFMILSMFRRFCQILKSSRYNIVIVRRELLLYNDYGNLFMEKFLLKLHPNAILDFDDDIAAAKNNPRKISSLYGKLLLEEGNKFNNTLRLYRRFIVASEYLKQRILQENPLLPPENICVIPTCVDYDQYPPKQYPDTLETITFGWIGGDHNYFLLDWLMPILSRLAEKYTFRLLVIGGKEYCPAVPFPVEFRRWTLESEVHYLLQIDVGLMPLTDTPENRGKGGFKLIQYMGLGIVSVATALTINREIVEHGVDSFLATTEEEWEQCLIRILERKIDFATIGKNARRKIEQNYTFTANKGKYIHFIEKTCAG